MTPTSIEAYNHATRQMYDAPPLICFHSIIYHEICYLDQYTLTNKAGIIVIQTEPFLAPNLQVFVHLFVRALSNKTYNNTYTYQAQWCAFR